MTSIRPGRAGDILHDAVKKMDAVMASISFTKEKLMTKNSVAQK